MGFEEGGEGFGQVTDGSRSGIGEKERDDGKRFGESVLEGD